MSLHIRRGSPLGLLQFKVFGMLGPMRIIKRLPLYVRSHCWAPEQPPCTPPTQISGSIPCHVNRGEGGGGEEKEEI